MRSREELRIDAAENLPPQRRRSSILQSCVMAGAMVTPLRRILLATRYSWQGLREAWRRQAAVRYEICLALLLVPLGGWLGRNGVERALLIGSWLAVIVVELINSAIETVVD